MKTELLAMRGLFQRELWFKKVADMANGDLGDVFFVAALTVSSKEKTIELGIAFKDAVEAVAWTSDERGYALALVDYLINQHTTVN